jgi:hypothetical protein
MLGGWKDVASTIHAPGLPSFTSVAVIESATSVGPVLQDVCARRIRSPRPAYRVPPCAAIRRGQAAAFGSGGLSCGIQYCRGDRSRRS